MDDELAKESASEADEYEQEQCDVNNENEHAPRRAATPSSDRSSRHSLESALESEEEFGDRQERMPSVDAHLIPSVLSFSKKRTVEQPEEAPFAETEHQKHQQRPKGAEGEGPPPSAGSDGYAAAASRGTRGARKKGADTASHGGAREQRHQRDELLAASEHGVTEPEVAGAVVADEMREKHNVSNGQIPEDERRRSRHASSASSHRRREHRHHHHHHHKDHKVRSYVCVAMAIHAQRALLKRNYAEDQVYFSMSTLR